MGELISDAEADVREDDSYLFDLDNKVSKAEFMGRERFQQSSVRASMKLNWNLNPS